MSHTQLDNRVLIQAKDFKSLFGVADSTRADWENPKSPRFDETFPKKVRLGKRWVGYYVDEVLKWLASRKSR